VAPGKGVAKGEYILTLMPSQTANVTTANATYTGISRSYVAYWDPSNWPTAMTWTIETLRNGFGYVGIFQYDNSNANLIMGAVLGEQFDGTGYANPPVPFRGGNVVMPGTAMWLTVAIKQTNTPNVSVNGVRLIGIPS
jgi:hypothetical protein